MYIQLMKSLGLIRKGRKRFQVLHRPRKVKLTFPQSLSGLFKGLTTNHQLSGRRKQSPKSHLSCNFFPCSGVFILKLLVFRLISTLYLPTIPTSMKPCFYGDRETVENIKKKKAASSHKCTGNIKKCTGNQIPSHVLEQGRICSHQSVSSEASL